MGLRSGRGIAICPLYLNVASSTCMLKGFVNLDNHVLLGFLAWPRLFRRALSADKRKIVEQYEALIREMHFLRHDCRKPLPLKSGSVDHILCSHFLEHVFPSEAEEILRDFHRALRPGGTVHIIVPDLLALARKYVESAGVGGPLAADDFVRATLLSRESPGSVRFRILQFLGGYGLDHRWMYDKHSVGARLTAHGFALLPANDTPSRHFREGDGSVHVVAQKVP